MNPAGSPLSSFSKIIINNIISSTSGPSVSRDGVVGIETDYGLDGEGSEFESL
jgi:hypothetical protein